MYAIHSIFSTVQGEGVNAGIPATFVRFAGCNLWSGQERDRHRGPGACSAWCDTDFLVRLSVDAAGVLARVEHCGNPLVVFTGGEPALQLDTVLVTQLRARGFSTAIETNGTHDISDMPLDWIACSPKLGCTLAITRCDELKVVVPGSDTADWTDEDLFRLRGTLSPLHCFAMPRCGRHGFQDGRGFARAVEIARGMPGWRVGVQAHKLWGAA